MPEIILVLETNLIFDFGLQKKWPLGKRLFKLQRKAFQCYKKTIYTINYFKIIITASLLSIGGFLVVTTNEYWQFVEIIILLVINPLRK
jgi:hypothetical protein